MNTKEAIHITVKVVCLTIIANDVRKKTTSKLRARKANKVVAA